MITSNSSEQKEKRVKAPNWTDEEKNYLRDNINKSVAELAKDLNRSQNSIRTHKNKYGLKRGNCPMYTDEEKSIIADWYTRDQGVDLEGLSKFLNRPKTSISCIARKMGLTHYGNYTKEQREYRSKKMKIMVKSIEHPRGMLGKHHSPKTLINLSEINKLRAQNMTYEERHKIALKAVETKRANGGFQTTHNAYSRCKQGIRKDLCQYFRSSWEANIVRYFNYNNIKWKYECKRFGYPGEQECVLSYQPDFYLYELNIWVEVKGWMDEKSKKRLDLFEKYYPEENSVVSVTVNNCKECDSIVKYLPVKGQNDVEDNIYHSEIHKNETEFKLTKKQSQYLANAATIELKK